jgi:hypothetical protein
MSFLISILEKLAVLLAAFFAGKQQEKKEQMKQSLKDVQTAKDIDHEVENLGYGAVDDRLRESGWMRSDDK